jgi:CRISPR-associated endonuclease/helicase Cas3
LVAHALDVAAVALLLPHDGLELDGRALGWLVSLHDIGKFSRPFQAKAREHWPEAWLGALDPDDVPPPGPKHDALALVLLEDVAEDLLAGVLPLRQSRVGWARGDRAHLFRAIAGHHGRPVAKPDAGGKVLGPGCKAAARAFVQAMTDVFRPLPLPCPSNALALAQLEWSLAGLTTLADWVGSRQAWFPYVPETAVADPAAYLWTRALPRAAAALAAAGLLRARPAPFRGLQTLFPGVTTPSPVQRWAEEAALPDGPVLAVVEDLTGSGKTEAAVTLTHRLLASGRAHGVFLALPTMATANAMFDRMAVAYRRLFGDGADPSLVLAHGRAALDARFAPGFEGEATSTDASSRDDPADEPAESHCAAWLAEDRRRALLAEVGVGTIDQALLAVLPVRHATLRQHGLRGKVLVVDEAHAFDPYMQEELGALLQFHAAMGGSAILLSATLPHAARQRLVDAFRKGLGAARRVELESTAYPLATLTGAGDAVVEQPCDPRDGLPRTVAVIRVPDLAGALARVVESARAGAAVVWVRNTVDDALAAAALLRAEGIEPLVFHARFALCDRLQVEAEVLRRFGRKADPAQRAGVLVATQVVEQSLDLDFDLLCTDLAPIDSLIQRAGRLWRHERDKWTRVLAGPELLVLSPEPVAAPAAGWIADLLPGTAAVYRNPALLWRSARAIFARGTLVTPDDMRPMIEAAAEGEVPPGLAAMSYKAMGEGTAAAGIGRQNVLDFRRGYTPGSGAWEPDTHTPTRLEDRPQVTLRLARRLGDRIVPYAPVGGARNRDDVRRAWSLSEVSVAEHRLASCPLPPEWRAAGQATRQGWGRWERDSERFVLALLGVTGEEGTYTLVGQAADGAPVQARYTLQEGLCWTDGGSLAA